MLSPHRKLVIEQLDRKLLMLDALNDADIPPKGFFAHDLSLSSIASVLSSKGLSNAKHREHVEPSTAKDSIYHFPTIRCITEDPLHVFSPPN